MTAVHVIELDPDVVRLVKEGWSQSPWAGVERCTVTQGRIEEFLATTRDRYDTVYVDTWDAIYHEYLPHLNELNRLAEPILNPGGEILLWARDLMVRHFLGTTSLVAERRVKYVNASAAQMANIAKQYPLLHRRGALDRSASPRDQRRTRAWPLDAVAAAGRTGTLAKEVSRWPDLTMLNLVRINPPGGVPPRR